MNLKKADCYIKNLLAEAKENLQKEDTKRLYNIPQINYAYVDTINGRIATIIVQKTGGAGLTSIYIKDCKTEEWIGLQAQNLSLDKQDLVLKIFKSINR